MIPVSDKSLPHKSPESTTSVWYEWPRLAAILLLLALALLLAPPLLARSPLPSTIYLPLIIQPERSGGMPAIWSHTDPPPRHEVTLFRHTFTLTRPISRSTLAIFADTRYEVWIDGEWTGRGPARFSRQTHEYDTYALDMRSPGSHLLAVLVQWAPNYRRSESTTPLLRVSLQEDTASGLPTTIARSGSHWKTHRSTAWRAESAPVHIWGMIGPTELLDLRKLPPDWMLPDFPDTHWGPAVVKQSPSATFQPRSIPPLASVPMSLTVDGQGMLAPHCDMGEVPVAAGQQTRIPFRATASGHITVETLALPDSTQPTGQLAFARYAQAASTVETSLPITVSLNGQVMRFGPSTSNRAGPPRPPDIRVAASGIASGTHTLTISGTTGAARSGVRQVPVCLTTPPLTRETTLIPFAQGSHAGRRLLLAEPVPDPVAVLVGPDDTLSLEVVRPPAYVVLDTGRIIHGRLTATISGTAGTVVDIGWDERLWEEHYPLPSPGSLHSEWNQTDSWILDGQPRTISTLDTRAGQYLLIAVWGNHPVTLSQVQVHEERAPLVRRGSFHSNNDRLNQIWQTGVDTLYPNMTDAYADPWRERGQWWGDSFVVDHVNQVALGDTHILRRGLWLMSEPLRRGEVVALAPNGEGTLLLDYGMLWVHSLADYKRQTGDNAFVLRVYPSLVALMETLEGYEHDETHLLDIPLDLPFRIVLLDWAAHLSSYGQSTALNALYAGTLQEAARLAVEVAEDPTRARLWQEKAERVRLQVNTLFYQPEQGRYLTGIIGEQAIEPTPQAQAWPLAYDLVPDAEQQRVADALVDLLSDDPTTPNLEISGMFWVLEALGKTQRFSDALDIIERYYGYMLDQGATTWWEGFNAHEHYWAALSHGWGGSPTWFLTTYGLGVRRTGPDRWQVRPGLRESGALSGSLPLQQGKVGVRWWFADAGEGETGEQGETMRLTLDAPPHSNGEVIIPRSVLPPDATLLLNGATVWQHGEPQQENITAMDNEVHLVLAGGEYVLEVIPYVPE